MHQPQSGQPGAPRPGPDLVAALADLMRRLDGMAEMEEMCQAIAGFAVDVLGADLAGVSMRPSRGARSRLASSHAALAALDDADGPLGDGTSETPEQEPVSITDTRSDGRWPRWTAAAEEHGVLAALFLPVAQVGRHSIVLELYSRTAGAFEGRGSTGLEAAVEVIGLTLSQVQRRVNLETALGTRDMIGQAQGMIMERYDLGGEQAMDLLRRISQDSQAKIQQIARRLVEGDDPSSPV